ncbi:hypothetical protein A2572_02510 [Candidatus Collierbacteria bacterium RIFOXYD1_FULL_40_9]|uniref:Uncharacterized protein n=1 Tax=Candidatus Collierbacteria bacterium RIFOXYD1_FULL_40_9 TaxID=1817731 RepID=A0A1F5FPD9_9BACT|nr:MAG: hypothetical protein A2572_02510 [Candidatus Collierbacteria bacterium RIFOXYD1_FULL_40_9]
MKQIASIKLEFIYEKPENEQCLNNAFNRIFELATSNMAIDSISTSEYSSKYGRNRAISNTRRSCEKNESEANNGLQNVSDRENVGDKIRKLMENKQGEIYSIIEKERE